MRDRQTDGRTDRQTHAHSWKASDVQDGQTVRQDRREGTEKKTETKRGRGVGGGRRDSEKKL